MSTFFLPFLMTLTAMWGLFYWLLVYVTADNGSDCRNWPVKQVFDTGQEKAIPQSLLLFWHWHVQLLHTLVFFLRLCDFFYFVVCKKKNKKWLYSDTGFLYKSSHLLSWWISFMQCHIIFFILSLDLPLPILMFPHLSFLIHILWALFVFLYMSVTTFYHSKTNHTNKIWN